MAVELKVGIGADISDLKTGLTDAEKQIQKFLQNVTKIGEVGEKISSIGKSLSVGLTLPIVGFAAAAVSAYGDIEALKKGLEAVTGSADAANKEFTKLQVVSKLPGLGMEEAVKGSINLQAIGLSADKSRDILSQFGNAVATVGKGRAEFERAVYGVQQLANTDFPLGEDLNIIKDALPQVSNLLKEAFGTSRSDELAKMGKSSKEVLDTILVGLGKLPRVTGGIKGAFENMGDGIKTAMARIGEVINKNFDISGIIDKLVGYIDKAVSAFENLSPTIQKTILVVAGVAAAIGPLLVVVGSLLAVLPSVVAGFGFLSLALTALTGPIGLVIIGVVGIVTAVTANWDKIKPYIINTINYFRELYNESFILRAGINVLVAGFKNAFAVIAGVVKTGYEVFKSFFKALADGFGGVGSLIKGALTFNLNKVNEGIGKLLSTDKSLFTNIGNDIKKGATDMFKDIANNTQELIANTFSKDKLKPITDINIFDTPKIADKVAEKVTNAVKKGVKKANEKIETDTSLGLDLTPIVLNSQGLQIGEVVEFDFLSQAARQFAKDSEMINASVASIPLGMSDAQIKMQYAGYAFQEALNQIIDDGIVFGITDAFTAMGDAMFNGGNIIAAAGASILSTLGQFMGMLGKEMIKLGIGTEVLGSLVEGIKKFLIANPGAAIALGAVAIAAGAMLSGASKSLSSGNSSGGGGSAPTTGGTGSQSYSTSFSSGGNGGGEVVFRISGNDLVGVLNKQQDKNTRLGA